MDKKSMILGTAKKNGLIQDKLQRLSGISKRTFDRRMANPDSITIAELRRLDQLARFEDKDLIKLIRERCSG